MNQKKRRILAQGKDKYSKISHKDKIKLLKGVICDHNQIKQTAQSLNINYSTAKTLMRKFKKHGELIDCKVLCGISRWYENYVLDRPRAGYIVVQNRKHKLKNNIQIHSQNNNGKTHRIPHISQINPQLIQIFQQVLFKE